MHLERSKLARCPLARATHATPFRSMSKPRGVKPSMGLPAESSGSSYSSASAVSGGFGPGSNRTTAPGYPKDDAHTDPSGAGATP